MKRRFSHRGFPPELSFDESWRNEDESWNFRFKIKINTFQFYSNWAGNLYWKMNKDKRGKNDYTTSRTMFLMHYNKNIDSQRSALCPIRKDAAMYFRIHYWRTRQSSQRENRRNPTWWRISTQSITPPRGIQSSTEHAEWRRWRGNDVYRVK